MIAPRAEVLDTPPAVHGGRLAIGDGRGRPRVRHDFSVCLNAYGPAPVVSDAIAASAIDEYPDAHCRRVRTAAADRCQLDVSSIAFGAGAAEFIHAVCFAFVRTGDTVLIATPAFGEYARSAALCGARVHETPVHRVQEDRTLLPDLIRDILHVRPRLTFFASPASPTGHAWSREELTDVADACARADSLLVLDQAFDAFTNAPLGTPALPGHSHVLHLRSITKDHALAGVRAAFAIAPPPIIDALERVRVPWAASMAAQAAGVAAMTDAALAHVRHTTSLLRAEAQRMATVCKARGMEVCRSDTHYFLVRTDNPALLRQQLLDHDGLLVRDATSFGLDTWIRVAARTTTANDALLTALATHTQLHAHASSPSSRSSI